MKNQNNTSKSNIPGKVENRSFRRVVKRLISSWIKRQNCRCRKELSKFSLQLEQMDDLIEIIAREVARQGKWLDAIGKVVGCGNQESNE